MNELEQAYSYLEAVLRNEIERHQAGTLARLLGVGTLIDDPSEPARVGALGALGVLQNQRARALSLWQRGETDRAQAVFEDSVNLVREETALLDGSSVADFSRNVAAAAARDTAAAVREAGRVARDVVDAGAELAQSVTPTGWLLPVVAGGLVLAYLSR